MRKLIYILIGICCMGCSNFLDDYSQDLVIPQSIADMDEVILGSGYMPYGKVDELMNGSIGWWLHILDDDINTVIKSSASSKQASNMDRNYYGYTTWQLEVGRNYKKDNLKADDDLWNTLYSRINICNIILSELGDIGTPTEQEEKDGWRIRGEALFLRAQFYLMLVNVYANAYDPATAGTTLGVPLKLTEYVEHDPDKTAQFERTSVAEVYDRITKDLNEAVDCFAKGSKPKSIYRASREAALLLLSRTYLYMQDWKNAQKIAEDFLKLQKSVPSYLGWDSTAVLTVKSPEILFTQGKQNLQHAISGASGDFCVSWDLYNLYDTLDMRREIFFTHKDSIGLSLKYMNGDDPSYMGDLFMLRSPEGYLNLAEAYAMQDDAGNASVYLNQLRALRIKGYKDKTYSKEEIVHEVRNERRKELCFEGHRWFDLRRYAVCKKAPFQKVIDHTYARYDIDNRNLFINAEIYRLEKGDPAYTFAIPKSVLEFDMGMPDNLREKRSYVKVINKPEENKVIE